jgi:hypothetical protein
MTTDPIHPAANTGNSRLLAVVDRDPEHSLGEECLRHLR